MFGVAAVQGRGHEARGQPCQDYAAGRRANGICAIAIADGAGSAAHSDVGAQVVVDAALTLVTERFDDLLRGDPLIVRTALVEELRARVAAAAETHGFAVAELASTLLFVAVSADAFLAGNLGDGVVGCERRGELQVLLHPQHGEFLNETTFVTSSSAVQRLGLERGPLDGLTSFVLMSDGSADSLYARRERTLAAGTRTLASWLDGRAPAEVEAALDRSLREVISTSTRDDCCLAILRRVVASSSTLSERSPAFQGAFLECATPRALSSRVAVARAMADGPGSTAEIARRAGVSAGTARRHIEALRTVVRLIDRAEAPTR